jgi:hypothetical protein
VRPARESRAELEQRVVQQHQLAVGGQAAIRFEPVDMLLEGARRSPEARSPIWLTALSRALRVCDQDVKKS